MIAVKRLAATVVKSSAVLMALVNLALVAAWIRSHFAYDLFGYGRAANSELRIVGLGFSGGDFIVATMSQRDDDFSFEQTVKYYKGYFHQRKKVENLATIVGFYTWRHSLFVVHWSSEKDQTSTTRCISAPLWLVIIASMAWPLAWTVIHRRTVLLRSNRIRDGCCPSCGYDVRATPEKCPECGRLAG